MSSNSLLKQCLSWIWLGAFAFYQAGAFYAAQHEVPPPLRRICGNLLWPADWHMFAFPSRFHTKVEFQGYKDGAWKRLPMENWYPTHWESGYRWERRPVYDYASRQIAFLRAACGKSGDDKARLVRFRWRKTPGAPIQNKIGIRSDVLMTLDCHDMPPEPRVKVL